MFFIFIQSSYLISVKGQGLVEAEVEAKTQLDIIYSCNNWIQMQKIGNKSI